MEDENKLTGTADSEKREQLVRSEKIAKIVSFVQWALVLAGLVMSASRFSNDGMGRLGGVMMLAAAWVVSPIVTNLDALKKLSFVPKLIIQAVLAAALFAGGLVIASRSAGNIDEAPPAVSVEEICRAPCEGSALALPSGDDPRLSFARL